MAADARSAAQDHERFVDRVQGFAKLLPDYDLDQAFLTYPRLLNHHCHDEGW